MEDTSGFYKLEESGTLLFGPNGAIGQGYEIIRQEHESYQYPVDGWYWFSSEKEAREAFSLPDAAL